MGPITADPEKTSADLGDANRDEAFLNRTLVAYLIRTRPSPGARAKVKEHPNLLTKSILDLDLAIPRANKVPQCSSEKDLNSEYCISHYNFSSIVTSSRLQHILGGTYNRIDRLLRNPSPVDKCEPVSATPTGATYMLLQRYQMLAIVLNCNDFNELKAQYEEYRPSESFEHCGDCIACKLGIMVANIKNLKSLLLGCVASEDNHIDKVLYQEILEAIRGHCAMFPNLTYDVNDVIMEVKIVAEKLNLKVAEGTLVLDNPKLCK